MHYLEVVCCGARLGVAATAGVLIPAVVWRRAGGRPLAYAVLLCGIAVVAGQEALRLAAAVAPRGGLAVAFGPVVPALEAIGFGGILVGFLGLMDDLAHSLRRRERLADEARARAAEAHLHKAQLKAILDSATDYCILTCDVVGRITSYSTGGERVLGWRAEEVVGRASLEVFRAQGASVTVEELLRQVRRRGHLERKLPLRRKDGRVIAALVTLSPLAGSGDRPDGFVVVAKDITEMEAARETLRRERDFMRGIIETGGLFIVGINLADGRITLFNHGAEKISGWSRDEVVGRPFAEVFVEAPRRPRMERLLEAIRRGDRTSVGQHESVILTKGGRRRCISWAYSATSDEEGRRGYVVAFGQDVTARRRIQASLRRAKRELEVANRSLARLASTDYLTGLLNRRQADQLLHRELARARRAASPLTVVMMDLDRFKAINDTRGHEAGDRCLQHVGALLRERLRATDVVARYGGEEFLLVLPETGIEEAAVLVDQLRRRVMDQPAVHGDEPIRLTLSAGLAAFELHRPADAETLVRRADEAMYCAKNLGGNRVVIWDDIERDAVEPSLTATERARQLRQRVESLSRSNRQTFLENLYRLVDAVEARSPYNVGHSRHVAAYAEAIARELGLEPGEVEVVRRAARLQNLGKAAIPEEVIWKDAPLTKRDWALVCQHPAATVKILEHLSFLHREVNLIRHHHERPDGRGYPDGLMGEAIPLGSRIMAVAEALDAMTRPRPHRPALSLTDALDQLRGGALRQFDRRVVEATALAAAKAPDWPLAAALEPAPEPTAAQGAGAS